MLFKIDPKLNLRRLKEFEMIRLLKKQPCFLFIWLIGLTVLLSTCAQRPASKVDYVSCNHLSLSKTFDIHLKVTKFKHFYGEQDSCLVKIVLRNKNTSKYVDSLTFSAIMFLNDSYEDCDQVLSYSTGQNVDKEIVDNIYGDIVVADLNFDGLEDLAIMNDNGNAGTYYRFFFQGDRQKFEESQFLRDSMASFPTKINPDNKTLFIRRRAGACAVAENTFILEEDGNWRTKSKKIIDHCND